MSKICDLTGRKTTYGHKMKHRRGSSGGGGAWRFRAQKTRRTWEPNLKKVDVIVDGKQVKLKISMKAYKALRKYGQLRGVTLANPKV
jgi:ribosomal protein L28